MNDSALRFGWRLGGLGINRLSRHSWHFGWIVWSYGSISYVARLRGPRFGWSVDSIRPRIFAALTLVCMAFRLTCFFRR